MKSQKPSCRVHQTEEMELAKLKEEFSLTESEYKDLTLRYIQSRAKSDISGVYGYCSKICHQIVKERQDRFEIHQKALFKEGASQEKLKEMDVWAQEAVPMPENLRKLVRTH